jgi:hypothetical protein
MNPTADASHKTKQLVDGNITPVVGQSLVQLLYSNKYTLFGSKCLVLNLLI